MQNKLKKGHCLNLGEIVKFSSKLPKSYLKQIDDLANEKNVKKTYILRRAIETLNPKDL